jgi:sulfide dehydrogenase [flavocytochrome c] flavoprotein subunit
MSGITRRTFLQASGAVAAASALGLPTLSQGAESKARVVVIGGGYGGTIAAKYIQMADPSVRVTLIEKDASYISCPLSNEVLSGERDLASLTFNYRGLGKRGITVVRDEVVGIDPEKRVVKGKGKGSYPYDRLVISPGISFRWDAIRGMSEAATETIPHAWKAGPQTMLLQKQLKAMRNGGVCIIAAPPNPFRCPPGPYERAAQIALYLKHHKPKSKVLILDAKDAFSKQALFVEGWKRNYGDMIEWVSAAAGGAVEAIDVKKRVLTGTVEKYKGDVINLIPAQKAAELAQVAGLADASGWCPVDQ